MAALLMVATVSVGGASAGGGTTALRVVTSFPLQPKGANFLIESAADTTACMQANYGGAPTSVTVETCNDANDSQRWFMAQAADGSTVILDIVGACLNVSAFASGGSVDVAPCTFKVATQHFVYSTSTTDAWQNEAGRFCLTVVSVVPGSSVFVDHCRGTEGQSWVLTH
jgi:hypothetical protein